MQELAERYRFHHWGLEFADLFDQYSGFDLVLGNPPWIKVEWSEGGVLGDANPRFVFDNLSASDLDKLREEAMKHHLRLRAEYFVVFEEAEATQNFLNGYQNYPILRGVQTNLYKCFLPHAWYISGPSGVAGYVHYDGMFNDPNGGSLRQEIYSRLRNYFQFENALKLFKDIGNTKHFELTVTKAKPTTEIGFDCIVNLFTPQTIDMCYEHTGVGSVPGIKDDNNNWTVLGHRNRIVTVNHRVLNLFSQLYDEIGTPTLQARLSAVHANEVLSVLEKFAQHPRRLSDLKDEYFPTEMWQETGAEKAGIIRRNTQFPKDVGQWILSGPHFYVGKPFHQTPRSVCETHRAYDSLDLELLPDAYLPRTNYVPDCDPVTYHSRTPKVPWDGKPVTELYRIFFRRQLSQSGERTLTSMIALSGAGHIHPVTSLTGKSKIIMDFAPLCLSIVFDFFIKTTGKNDLYESTLRLLPVIGDLPQQRQLQLRALLLNCLTSHYADLWEECWDSAFRKDHWAKMDPRLNNARFATLPPEWSRDRVLRTDFERRQALVEIDVLSAMALSLTCDELSAIYRIQFPVLRQNESDTWYDQNGRIVFTCSKGLPGVGLDRPQWEKESSLDKLTVSGLQIDGINPSDFRTIKNMPHGTVTRTVIDDTISDYRFAYGTFRKDGIEYHCPCPDYPEPIEGPVERDITYVAPFTKCDREEDYRIAWEHFEERFAIEERKSYESSSEPYVRAEIPG